ncbi:hypothetical protein TL16_g08767 [Triparma laevis f. inornata]|uniref:SSD domain-containing protein n=1 Tax=Triparma laevis f. inornata TaxID=1714386 RepID=A0A9W7EJ81_9STRA|nr:hypothetical protein TL16_g08767 [Triparma laevis f. inornata]
MPALGTPSIEMSKIYNNNGGGKSKKIGKGESKGGEGKGKKKKLKKKKKVKRRFSMTGFDDHVKPSRRVQVYAIFLTKYPCGCYFISCFVMLLLAVLGFIVRDDYPDFNKADRGFEPRGTPIGGAQKAYERHLQDAQCNGEISSYPDGTRTWHRWAYDVDDDVMNHQDFDGDGDADPAYCNKYAWPGYNPANDTRRALRSRSTPVHLKEITDEFYDAEDYDSPLKEAFQELLAGPKLTIHTEVEEYAEEYGYDFDFEQGRKLQRRWDEQFCSSSTWDVDSPAAINVVLKATDPGTDLLTLAPLKAACELDETIRARAFFNPNYCTSKMEIDRTDPSNPVISGRYCCKSRTIPNYVAMHANKTSCSEIVEEDVENFRNYLDLCADSYHVSDKLFACDTANAEELDYCKENGDASVPSECWDKNMAYDVFNALADWKYRQPGNQTLDTMKIGIPLQSYNDVFLMGLHEDVLFPKHMTEINPGVDATLIAYDMGIKFDVFNKQLLTDGILAVFAFFMVFVLIRVHTGSMFITILAYIEIMSALGVAYFLYMVVLNLPFFPFLNLVGIFIVIGIGADDVFVFIDAWKQAEVMMAGGSDQIHKRMAWTLQRAGGAMFVTSTTTSFAFFAGAVSSITSLRCFGIYTGLVVICDFFLMITYLPAVVILDHVYIQPRMKNCCNCFSAIKEKICGCCKATDDDIDESSGATLGAGERFFKNRIFPFVRLGRFLIVLVLGALGGGLTYKAQFLEKPSTGDFQLFHNGHPMELYEMIWKESFFQGGLSGSSARAYYPVTFVWGLEPTDTGDKMDPADHGEPVWTDLDARSQASQTWLVNFCSEVRNETWYMPLNKETVKYENCFMEDFKDWVTYPCENTTMIPDQSVVGWQKTYPKRNENQGCCSESFPLAQNKFGVCLSKYALTYGKENTGIWFDIDGTGTVKALVYNFVTNIEFSNDYGIAEKLYKTLRDFEKRAMSSAPVGGALDKGFMTSEFSFYDLQRSIGSGAYQSAGASTIIAFIVLVATTRNVILTFYSCLTIILICGVCTGILVLDGWELNILESIIFSVAVGMAVDFVAHYSHAYIEAPEKEGGGGHALVEEGQDRAPRSWCGVQERLQKTKTSLTVMGYSITSAAITTFIAGAVMCFSKTLFFYKFGVFMTLIMFMSWFFSTFFLMGSLACFGPVGDWGDIFCGFKGLQQKDLEDELELLETAEDKMQNQINKKMGKWNLKDLEAEEEAIKLANKGYENQTAEKRRSNNVDMFG